MDGSPLCRRGWFSAVGMDWFLLAVLVPTNFQAAERTHVIFEIL
jgi:hypothetical protein